MSAYLAYGYSRQTEITKDGQENVNHHSDNSKIDKVGDDYVAKTPNSVFREKCLTRRFRRRF